MGQKKKQSIAASKNIMVKEITELWRKDVMEGAENEEEKYFMIRIIDCKNCCKEGRQRERTNCKDEERRRKYRF